MVGANGSFPFGWIALGGNGSGGGGGQVEFNEVTYAQAQTLVSGNNLQPGSFYKITDRGDQGILLQATSATTFAPQGVRYMLCPSFYGMGTSGGNDWLGIWNPNLGPLAGQLAIWGGLVWENLTGAVGSAISETQLDGTNWSLITKSAFSNQEYTSFQFDIIYEFGNDWIARQWDKAGNVVGIDFQTNQDVFGLAYNPCDVTDWNLADGGPLSFYNNKAVAIFNNSDLTELADNTVAGLISGNVGVPVLSRNRNNGVTNNNLSGSGNADISDNSNEGAIYDNAGSCGAIKFNSNIGDIGTNTNTGVITNNTNAGTISENSFTGFINKNDNTGNINNNTGTATEISNNSNTGNIVNNNDFSSITSNKNTGHISGNDGTAGGIANNQNDGSIINNTNTGAIALNINLGNIQVNVNNGSILNNRNTGDIVANANTGDIDTNSNNGIINANESTIVNIRRNINNGNIEGCSASVGTINILDNTNNGSISGSFAADVTDPVVNKT